jgi:hypothetical protein
LGRDLGRAGAPAVGDAAGEAGQAVEGIRARGARVADGRRGKGGQREAALLPGLGHVGQAHEHADEQTQYGRMHGGGKAGLRLLRLGHRAQLAGDGGEAIGQRGGGLLMLCFMGHVREYI